MQTLVAVVVSGLILGALYLLMAQGLSLVFGVVKIINLAHGEFALLGAYLAWSASTRLGLDPLVTAPIAAVGGFLFGWLLCRLLIVRIIDRPPLMMLLLTYGIAIVIQAGLVLLLDTTPRTVTTAYSDITFRWGVVHIPATRAVIVLAALLVLAALWVFLKRSRLGKAIRATGQNREAAAITGIDVTSVQCIVFGLGTALVVISGVLMSSTISFNPFIGALFTFKAFAIVVLGGVDKLWGLALAAAAIGLIEEGVASYVPSIGTSLGVATSFVLIVIALLVMSGRLTRRGLGVPR